MEWRSVIYLQIGYLFVLSWKIIRNSEEVICEGTFRRPIVSASWKTNVYDQRTEQYPTKHIFTPYLCHSRFSSLSFISSLNIQEISSNDLLFRFGLLALKTVKIVLLQVWCAYLEKYGKNPNILVMVSDWRLSNESLVKHCPACYTLTTKLICEIAKSIYQAFLEMKLTDKLKLCPSL